MANKVQNSSPKVVPLHRGQFGLFHHQTYQLSALTATRYQLAMAIVQRNVSEILRILNPDNVQRVTQNPYEMTKLFVPKTMAILRLEEMSKHPLQLAMAIESTDTPEMTLSMDRSKAAIVHQLAQHSDELKLLTGDESILYDALKFGMQLEQEGNANPLTALIAGIPEGKLDDDCKNLIDAARHSAAPETPAA